MKKANIFLLLTRACNYGKIKLVIEMEKNRNLTQPAESVKTKDILAASLKGFYNNHKKLSKVLIAFAVLIVVLVAVSVILHIPTVQTAIYNSFIPETLTDDRTGIVFYREGNPDFGHDNSIQSSMKVYYYLNNDPENEKVYLQDGIFHSSDGGSTYVAVGFVLSVLLVLQKIVDIVQWVAVCLAVLIVVLLIVAWYRSFKKQEEERKAKYRNSHPRH